ncbi:hypothetical protein SLS53_004619 [Cytospora paraplurivora]|uniref:Uncharacterized protein n=1 Tax=Cytospora paraplurivora TaxID=2898453 RepID=A0AAN9U6V3_9PEZI
MGLFNCITNVIIMLHLDLEEVTVVSAIRIDAMVNTVDLTDVAQAMDLANFLTNLEVNLSIICNSLPMLIPLYATWKHRRCGGDGEDEYVSRIRGASTSRQREFLVQDLTNGLPLETIYGKNNIHFTATVGRGEPRSAGNEQSDEDNWDSESTRRLPWNAQAITIETKWSITEERAKQ